MTNEKDKALVEAAITKQWTNGERERHSVNQQLLADLLAVCATIRKEEREAAFNDAAVIASDFRRLDQDTLWARYKTLALETALLGATEK